MTSADQEKARIACQCSPNRNASDVVLLTQLLGQRRAHDVAADRAGSLEVVPAGLSAGRRHIGVGLHLDSCVRGSRLAGEGERMKVRTRDWRKESSQSNTEFPPAKLN